MTKTLLALFAHPDDEAFGTGGTLAQFASNGTRVVLVCATNGDVGEISDPALATPETLAVVRQQELACAAERLGVEELILLGYRDSGMEGTTDNEDPRAFINAAEDEVVARLVGIMRRVQPQVVVTFEPNGGYGHPDHVAIHRHTVAAFHAAGDASRYPEQGQACQPDRLFYTAIPRSLFVEMRERLDAMGEDVSMFRRFDETGMGWPDDQVHVVVDVSEAVDVKWDALHCHATQFGPDNLFRRLPEDVTKRMMSAEHFALAVPEPEPGLSLSGLFAGLS